MKIFWWQAGLHFEPENEQDSNALMLLWEAKKQPPPAYDNANLAGCVVNEQFQDRIV
jgi:hypothetical protein